MNFICKISYKKVYKGVKKYKKVLTSVKQFGIIHIENDKRDGDIGQISQWFPFCSNGLQICKNHFDGGNYKKDRQSIDD